MIELLKKSETKLKNTFIIITIGTK